MRVQIMCVWFSGQCCVVENSVWFMNCRLLQIGSPVLIVASVTYSVVI